VKPEGKDLNLPLEMCRTKNVGLSCSARADEPHVCPEALYGML